jgi:chromosome segregation ATPase
MPPQKEIPSREHIIFEEILRNFENTAEQVRRLLSDLNDSKIDLAAIKSEFTFIVENVKDLSSIIRDNGDGHSILTRIALIEQSIKEIEEYIEKDNAEDKEYNARLVLVEEKIRSIQNITDSIYRVIEDRHNKEEELAVVKASGKWKLYVALATGTFGIIGTIITIIIALLSK